MKLNILEVEKFVEEYIVSQSQMGNTNYDKLLESTPDVFFLTHPECSALEENWLVVHECAQSFIEEIMG
jgi:hypothetical protein